MSLAKIYGVAWLVLVGTALGFIAAGSWSNTVTMVLGFALSVLAGAGILVVYPVMINEEVAANRGR